MSIAGNAARNFTADREWPLRGSPLIRTWIVAGLLAVAGAAALSIDLPLARWVHAGGCPASLQKVFTLSEVFSHGIGVCMVLLTIGVLDPPRRAALPRMLAASLGAGLASNILKLLAGRTRPGHFDLSQDIWHSFGDWLPLLSNASAQQSLPSSHAATAAGLAVALSFYYPRGRWLFIGLASCAVLQRIVVEAHFASDILWGAAIGCAFAPLCVFASPLARCFDALEAKLAGKSAR